jgi:hypothetical protein
MESPLKVHVFQGSAGAFRFTDDLTGAKLPKASGPLSLIKTLNMNKGETPRVAVSTDDAMDGIAANGYYVTSPSIIVGP